jgi:methyltransferase (TIGR00027 family)
LKPGRASRTAEGVAAIRAAETMRPSGERLFTDPYAKLFLRPAYRILIELSRLSLFRDILVSLYDRRLPGALGIVLCRTCYIDDALGDALRDGADQVVILGAGFDSRACRLPGIERARVFEVDHPDTQARKRACLSRVLDPLPSHVVFVPVDFDRDRLSDALDAAGYRRDAKTFFIWEGVTSYLTAEAVDATFRFVASGSAPGSRIVFTYLHRGLLDGTARFEGAAELMAFVRRAGEPFSFGLDPEELPAYLGARGLALVEDVGASEYQARYMTGPGPRARVSPFTRAAIARVTGPPPSPR